MFVSTTRKAKEDEVVAAAVSNSSGEACWRGTWRGTVAVSQGGSEARRRRRGRSVVGRSSTVLQ